jgi:beta-glucanase (GH16 family)
MLGLNPFESAQWTGCQSDGSAKTTTNIVRSIIPAGTYDAVEAIPLSDESIAETMQPAFAAAGSSDDNAWTLVWADEFDKPNINLEYWSRVDRKDNFNNELQYYIPANAFIRNGCLVLTAKKEDRENMKYTSGMVQTQNKLLFRYGLIEARIKLPTEPGLLSALWLLGEQDTEEIDVMEMAGCEPGVIYGVSHYNNCSKKTYGSILNDSPEEFHVYACEWGEEDIKWYLDGKLFYETTTGVPSDNMFIVLTLAVGGDWPGPPDNTTVFPASMEVDYIRLYMHE